MNKKILVYIAIIMMIASIFSVSILNNILDIGHEKIESEQYAAIIRDNGLSEFEPSEPGMTAKHSTRASNTQSGISQWDSNVLWSRTSKTSGCTIGDLDSTCDGNEIVIVSSDGDVTMLYRSPSGAWNSQQLWQGEGELITPVIADFYDGNDGNELVVVGMSKGLEGEGAGQATMIYGSGDTWHSAIMYIAPNMLHGLAVGDLDPMHNGTEVIVMSFGYEVTMLTWNETVPTDWITTHMWHAEGKVRKGVIDDLDPKHPGNELVVVDKSGNCTMLSVSGTTWNVTTLWTDPGTPGLARITVGDIDANYPGKEIVVGGDSCNVGIIRRTGDTWDGKVIFTDSDKIRGLGVGDVDPTKPGNEILVFGYSMNITMLTGSGETWKSRVLFTDTGKAHDLAIGEFEPAHAGLEMVFTGYSKNATMLGVSPWYYDVMFSRASKTSGCTIGDLDSTRAGNEVVVASSDGNVAMLYKSSSGHWESQQLWQGEGELITPVIADFYEGNDGNELVVVGMSKGLEGEGAGQATMIYGSGDTWNSAIMYIAPDMLHGLAVGDLDPEHDGSEVIVMSFGYDVTMLTWNETVPTDWKTTHMWHAEGKVRKGVIDDLDPTQPGNELVVVDKSGNCTLLSGSGMTWSATTLWTDPGTPGLARVVVGDVDTDYPGKEIVVGGDSSNVGIIWRTGNTWEGKVIFTDSNKIRGLGIGDVDPTQPGNEIVVFGYSQKVTMLTKNNNIWTSSMIFKDTGRAHDLALGEFDPEHKGQEIVFVGYSNNATMLMNSELTEKPDFSIYAYPLTQTVYSSDTVEFTVGVLSLGGFNDPVKFSLEDLPQGLSANYYPSTVIPDSTVTLTITVPITNVNSDIDFTVKAESGELYQMIDLHLSIIGDSDPPSVESTHPSNDAVDIPAQTPIVVWFSEPIANESLTESAITIIEDESGLGYTGTFQYDQESNMLIISDIHEKDKTTSGLPNSKLIKITLGTSISDLAGNKLSNYQFKFITSSEDLPSTGSLEIKWIYPTSASTGIPVDSPIVIKFNVPVDSTTLNWNNIEITSDKGDKYVGTINYDPNSLTLTITDIHLLDEAKTGFLKESNITVTLKTGIRTLAGEPLSAAFNWHFDIGETVSETASEDDNAKEERDMYLMGLIVAVVIIILLLLGLVMKGKSQKEQESKHEDERVKNEISKPSKPKGSKKK